MEDYKKPSKKDPGINQSVFYRKQDGVFSMLTRTFGSTWNSVLDQLVFGRFVIFANDH